MNFQEDVCKSCKSWLKVLKKKEEVEEEEVVKPKKIGGTPDVRI